MNLLSFRRNTYSQNGEDGIVAEILRVLKPKGLNNWCVEFGAWDGKHMSNTFNLVEKKNYRAVYIEGNSEYFKLLEKTVIEFPSIVPIYAMISDTDDEKSLDSLLKATELPYNYDLLSIDIDTYDLAVWANHLAYRPKVVIIEINSGIQPGILEWHHHFGRGNSFSATLSVAKSKGYTLICHTGNLIFIDDAFIGLYDIDKLDLEFPERMFRPDYEYKNN